MYNSQYYTCEEIDQRLLQGYLDDYNEENNTSLTKSQFLEMLATAIQLPGDLTAIANDLVRLVKLSDSEASNTFRVYTVTGSVAPTSFKAGDIFCKEDNSVSYSDKVSESYYYYVAKVDGPSETDFTDTDYFASTIHVSSALLYRLAYLEDDLVAIKGNIGYYTCNTASNQANKIIESSDFTKIITGGSIKVTMVNTNTVANPTLNINNTGAKPLFYNGKRASANNTWLAGETVDIYYDGTNYMANNVAGGGGTDEVFDISVYNNNATYDDLAAALGTNGVNVPAEVRKGGMSVKFIKNVPATYSVVKSTSNTQPTGTALDSTSSIESGIYNAEALTDFSVLPMTVESAASVYYFEDSGTYTIWIIIMAAAASGEYVQYRLMSTDWSIVVNDWQGVDSEPTDGSRNLVESGGAFRLTNDLVDLAENTIWYQNITIRPSDGTVRGGSGLMSLSDFIDVSMSSKITVKWLNTTQGCNAFYDENFGFISAFGYGTNREHYSDFEIAVPENAVYVRVTKFDNESPSNKQGVYWWRNVKDIQQKINENLEILNEKYDELKNITDIGFDTLVLEKPLADTYLDFDVKSGDIVNIKIIETSNTSTFSILVNGTWYADTKLGGCYTYQNTSDNDSTVKIAGGTNKSLKVELEYPLKNINSSIYSAPKVFKINGCGNVYISKGFCIIRGIKYTLDINNWDIYTASASQKFNLTVDNINYFINEPPHSKVELYAEPSNSSNFAFVKIEGRINEGSTATITLSTEDIPEQTISILGQGSTILPITNLGVRRDSKYILEVKNWISNHSGTVQSFYIAKQKVDSTSEIVILKTDNHANYSGIYYIDTTDTVGIYVNGRIESGRTATLHLYQNVSNIFNFDLIGEGSNYIATKFALIPSGVYKATIHNWNSVYANGGSFVFGIYDSENNAKYIKSAFRATNNFDGNYLIEVPEGSKGIFFEGRIVSEDVCNITLKKITSKKEFPMIQASTDFPIFGCSRYSVIKPGYLYAHSSIITNTDRYIFVNYITSDEFFVETMRAISALTVIDKYTRMKRHIEVFSPRAIYLNGVLIGNSEDNYVNIPVVVPQNDTTILNISPIKRGDNFSLFKRVYNAETNELGDVGICSLLYDGNTVEFTGSAFVSMVNELYNLSIVIESGKASLDLPRLCKYNDEFYGAFNLDELLENWVEITTVVGKFVIMKTTDGNTWEPVCAIDTNGYQVTETDMTYYDGKFYIVGRDETIQRKDWYCVVDAVNHTILKEVTELPGSFPCMPTITTSHGKVYAAYNISEEGHDYSYTRHKINIVNIATSGNYEVAVIKTYSSRNGIHYMNMTSKSNGDILMTYANDARGFLSAGMPTTDISLVEIEI